MKGGSYKRRRVFVRPKKDGTHRMILNLKQLNENVEYKKFKMDTLESIVRLMRKDCFMCSLDLKNAYYTVPVAESHQAYLRFPWKLQGGPIKIYQYTCFPNGLSSAPRDFTKLLKPLLAFLRLRGVVIAAYIDDTYIQGASYTECKDGVQLTQQTFERLGFVINKEKSAFEPSKTLTMLGFVLNSVAMTVEPTMDKRQKIKHMCASTLGRNQCTIKELASLIGSLVSSFSGVEFGPLHYRGLEMLKSHALKVNKGNFQCVVTLNEEAREDLTWWIDNIDGATKLVDHGRPSFVIWSDASQKGWGASFQNVKVGGRWAQDEVSEHINVLETKALFFALKSLCAGLKNVHLRAEVDNSTAVCYVNAMGGVRSPKCNQWAKQIWRWCIERDIWLSAAHIAGVKNVEADEASRVFNDRLEWELTRDVFVKLCSELITPKIDLFATRLNAKLPYYVSWKPDPGAQYFDAFTICWTDRTFYAFPPFSLITRCLQKVAVDQAEGVMIVPVWPTQVWFPMLMGMLVNFPRLLPQGSIENPQIEQPLVPQMMACHLSGRSTRSRGFREGLRTLSCKAGEEEPRNNMGQSLTSGTPFVTGNKLVQILPL